MAEEGDVRIGDRVRWEWGYPDDFDADGTVGTVTSLVTTDGVPVLADVRWFGHKWFHEVPVDQLEVVARYDD